MNDTDSADCLFIDAESPVQEARIDPDGAHRYASATDDPNVAAYAEASITPPLYTIALILPTYLRSSRAAVRNGAARGNGIHVAHDVRFYRTLKPGCRVSWRSRVEAVLPTSRGVIVVHNITVNDHAGPAVEHRWSTLHVGRHLGRRSPEAPSDYNPVDTAHHFVGSHSFPIAPDQSHRYAEGSTDYAPIHLDDRAARAAGFPRKILQGTCTFAMCSGAVVKIASDGDLAGLHRLTGRFAAPVFLGDDLTVNVYDIGGRAPDRHRYGFEALSNGRVVVRGGIAEFSPS